MSWAGASAEQVRVNTSLGIITGGSLAGGARYFLGIPYAEPPVGALRFRPARPLSRPYNNGSGLDATAFGKMCPQQDVLFRKTAESCLFLNVWTPGDAGSGLPVMVWCVS